MAIADNFFSAACPEPWQVLGVKLRPFSLGHYIKMARLDCAFVSETARTATLPDLLLGVIVCSMPTEVDQEHDPFWRWLGRRRGGWRWEAYRLGKWFVRKPAASPAEYDAYLWGKRIGGVDLAEKVKLFSDYMESCSAMPPYVEEGCGGAGKISGAHWTQSVLSSLVSRCGYNMREALNVPLSLALADFIKQAETDGAVRILPGEAVA